MVVISAACVLVAIGVVAFWPGEREPEYNGKKLSEWLEVCRQYPMPGPERVPAEEAVRNIGTNALPWLIRWMNYDMPGWKQTFFQSKYSRLVPKFAMYYFIKPIVKSRHAQVGFVVLDTTAGPAAPALARIMDNWPKGSGMQALVSLRSLGADAVPPLYAFATNRAKPLQARREAMSSIGMLSSLGTNEEWIVRAIIPYLSEEEMAEPTARALGAMRLRPDVCVPALRKALASKNPEVRVWAVVSLGRFGREAEQAIPELTGALADSDPRVHQEAGNALERIAQGVPRNGVKDF